MNRPTRSVLSPQAILFLFLIIILSLSATSALAQPERGVANDAAAQSGPAQAAGGILQLQQDTGGTAVVSRSNATGVASFVRFTDPGALGLNQAAAAAGGNPEAKSAAFFAQ